MHKLTQRTLSVLLATLLGTAALNATVGDRSGASHEVRGGEAGTAAHDAPSFTMDGEVEVLLLRLGISQDAVAAAGISASGFQGLLSACQGPLLTASLDVPGGISAVPALLTAHDAQRADAKRLMNSLRRRVQSGLATEEEVAELQVAKAAYETASAGRAEFLDSVCGALCGFLPDSEAAALLQVAQNKEWKQLPVPYLAEARTDAEWLQIRNALASKRTFEEMGEDAPAPALAVLAELDARAAVATASASRDAELAGVEATWDAIFSE